MEPAGLWLLLLVVGFQLYTRFLAVRPDFDRFESPTGVVAGLVPATSNV